tara:strand:- start:9917 stop:10216 length:300 start_codon:yes stop_codon:yes gene_type:complete
MNPTPQLSKSGIAYRQQNGIPLDKPKAGKGRGGNYQITENQARAIWQDLQHYIATYPPKSIDITGTIATHHGVSRTLVNNIRHGSSWNSVTGLPVKERD